MFSQEQKFIIYFFVQKTQNKFKNNLSLSAQESFLYPTAVTKRYAA